MRLWTLHPRYLDPQGLVAGWREALLAQKVLQGLTRGYRHHPQLLRFQAAPDPLVAIGAFLSGLAAEADVRGYRFDASKIACPAPAATSGNRPEPLLTETRGQLLYEWSHLLRKLEARSPARFAELADLKRPAPHPLFRIVHGPMQAWEVI